MGGYSSGRYRTRNVGNMEQALALDIRTLRRRGALEDGCRLWRSWSWTWNDGSPAGSINVAADLTDPHDRHVMLTFNSDGEPRRQRIDVEAVPMRFGGFRFYFRCPRSGRRCEVLGSVRGYFASRQANRLAYASQSKSPVDRMIRARDKLADRLWPPKPGGRPVPRGANRERLMARWSALDEAAEAAMDVRLMGVWRRLQAMEARLAR